MSAPFFDPEVLKRCVMQPDEAAAFRAKAVKRYVVHVDADGAMLMEEADTDLLRARLIMEVALLRFSRWSLRLGENHKMPRTGEYPPAVQSVMDKMRDFLGVGEPTVPPDYEMNNGTKWWKFETLMPAAHNTPVQLMNHISGQITQHPDGGYHYAEKDLWSPIKL